MKTKSRIPSQCLLEIFICVCVFARVRVCVGVVICEQQIDGKINLCICVVITILTLNSVIP